MSDIDEPRLNRRFHAAELDRHIGERLCFIRRLSSLSQRQLADEIGLSFQQVQKYENGSNRVSAALLAELSGLFHLPMDWFIGPFNTCLEPDGERPASDYAFVLDRLYRGYHARSEGECQGALDLVCQVAGLAVRPQATRLLRLRRATRDSEGRSRDILLEVVRRLSDARPAPAVEQEASPDGDGWDVLLVDDDTDVLATISASLTSAGFSARTATSGEEAVALLETEARVSVIVTDYSMVGMDGVALLSRAARLRPGLPSIVITGFSGAERLSELPPEVEVLSKPFRRMELVGRIRLLIETISAPGGRHTPNVSRQASLMSAD